MNKIIRIIIELCVLAVDVVVNVNFVVGEGSGVPTIKDWFDSIAGIAAEFSIAHLNSLRLIRVGTLF